MTTGDSRPGPRPDPPVRWAAGTTFVPTPDGWLVHGPDEDFMVLEVPARDREAVADLIAGRIGADAALARVPDAADLIAELAVPRQEAVEVLLVGDGPLLAPLSRCLDRAGLIVRHGAAPDAATRVMVACAEHLPDAAWRELDSRCRELGVAWHRGHAEGRRWYAGPFTPPSGEPGYEDVRLRRLAACPWPDELAAYWAFLDAGGRPATPPDPAGAEVAAALIAADVRAWADGAEPPSGAGNQVGIDLVAGEIRRHPVLPVPRGLMREVPV
ncbi:hypothetical protein HNP84_004702 [Thermocatellispora tengchongensis]|uniref:Uncharacterized protein n=1 Tax=Thermocatellispora tengchongensis TaxID=1073253 RepID=A0A840P5M6_9ACTN|nr:hypothetical protein [Thermocatellispora tengchongensis]MBB5134968.1 hypothetical protein [Thermocatellispora tengchongensis]